MSTADGIAVVVVTHDSASTIADCLQRLQAADGVAQVRVVDNASRDDTVAIVQRHASLDPRVRFIANPDNPGFSAGCNQGAGDSDAPWLAFVNPDCLVEPDTLARLRAHAMAADGDVVLGADLVDVDGVRDGAARRHDPDFVAMLASPAARDLAIPLDASQVLQPVDAVSGALVLVARALYARIGGFDAGYRLHAEDLDFCRRARIDGAQVLVANDVQVVHVRGVSSRSRPVFVEWHKHRGLLRYFHTFDAGAATLPQRIAVAAGLWARLLVAVPRAMLRSVEQG